MDDSHSQPELRKTDSLRSGRRIGSLDPSTEETKRLQSISHPFPTRKVSIGGLESKRCARYVRKSRGQNTGE